FYRLHVFPIVVPPLRERPEDIIDLVTHFLARFSAEEGKRVRSISAPAIGLLAGYHWPGNVRQLENAVFRAVVLADDEEIGVGAFPQITAQTERGQACATRPGRDPAEFDGLHRYEVGKLADAVENDAPCAALTLLDSRGQLRALEDIEADVIKFAVSHY